MEYKNDVSLELASRRAKAQSYFDRYPERKGKGPYVPSATLLTPAKTGSRKSSLKSEHGSGEAKVSSQQGSDDAFDAVPQSISPKIFRASGLARKDDERSTMKQWHSRGDQSTPPAAPRTDAPAGRTSDSVDWACSSSAIAKNEHAKQNGRPVDRRASSATFGTNSVQSTTNEAARSGELIEPYISERRRLKQTAIEQGKPYVSSSSSISDGTANRSRMKPTEEVRDVGGHTKRSTNDTGNGTQDGRVGENADRATLISATIAAAAAKFETPKKRSPNVERERFASGAERFVSKQNLDLPPTHNGSPSLDVAVLSIDDIIRKHSPSSASLDRTYSSRSSASFSQASPTVRSRTSDTAERVLCSSRTESQRPSSFLDAYDVYVGASVEEDDSDTSSLDSVEREVRDTLHTPASKTDSRRDLSRPTLSPALQAAFGGNDSINGKANGRWNASLHSQLMTPSVSAPALLHKKSSPNLPFTSRQSKSGRPSISPVDELKRAQHRSMSSSSSVASNRQATIGASPMPPSKLSRSKSSANIGISDLGKNGNRHEPFLHKSELPPLPPLPTSTKAASKTITLQRQRTTTTESLPQDDTNAIRDYVQSTRLTRLVTLQRAPYAGRVVSLADVGDASGHAVFLFLGLGAVRYLVGLYDEMAAALGLRIICIDRWGMGKTDDVSSEKRGVLEWSNVVSEVADLLSINRFSLLAHSAGAPYAMATCLALQHRIVGPVYLLAPWVSPTIESGYKWLRYVPDGIIRTAQAADWRMQGWKLGASPSGNASGSSASKGVGDTSGEIGQINEPQTQAPSQRLLGSSGGSLASASTDTASSSSFYSPITPSPSSKTSHSDQARPNLARARYSYEPSHANGTPAGRRTPSVRTSSSSMAENFDLLDSWHARQMSDASLSTLPPAAPPKTPMKNRSSSTDLNMPGYAANAHVSSSSLPPSSPTGSHGKMSLPQQQTIDLSTELLRASHAESGGSANDLLVILGRSSQKPWGFSYVDVRHPVRVWHGEKDERVSLSSVLWMERELDDCRVKIIKGANHGLLTNVAVVVETLDHIASHATGTTFS